MKTSILNLIKNNSILFILFAIIIGFLTSANKEKIVYKNIPETEKKVQGYTPFEVGIWHLKTAESFRPNLYPDGKFPSIAFGYNLIHGKVKVPQTWKSGTELLYNTYGKVKKEIESQSRFDDLDEWQKMAIICRFYNRGTGSMPAFGFNKVKDLQYCNNGSYECIHKTEKIAKAHKERRMFEYYIFTHQFNKLDFKQLKQDCIDLQNRYE